MLQIQGGNHADALRDDLFDILPAMRIPAAGRILPRKFINETDLRCAGDDALRDVDRLAEHGNEFQVLRKNARRCSEPCVCNEAMTTSCRRLASAKTFVEHAYGFAHAGRIAEEQLEPTTRSLLFPPPDACSSSSSGSGRVYSFDAIVSVWLGLRRRGTNSIAAR
jgi:hypothetical protein